MGDSPSRKRRLAWGRVSGGAPGSSSEHDDRCRAGASQPTDDRAARLAARAGFGAGVAGALAQHAAGGATRCSPSCGRGPCRPRSGRSPAPPRAPARRCSSPWRWSSAGAARVAGRGLDGVLGRRVADAGHRAAGSGGRRVVAGRVRDRLRDLALPGVAADGERAAAGRARRQARRRWRRWSGRRCWPPGTSRCRPRRRPGSRCSCSAASPRCSAGWPCPRGACAWRAGCARPGRAAPGGTTRTGNRVAGRDDQPAA